MTEPPRKLPFDPGLDFQLEGDLECNLGSYLTVLPPLLFDLDLISGQTPFDVDFHIYSDPRAPSPPRLCLHSQFDLDLDGVLEFHIDLDLVGALDPRSRDDVVRLKVTLARL